MAGSSDNTSSPILDRGVASLARQFRAWSSGLDNEIEFWTDWVTTKGCEWPEDFEQRLTPGDRWLPDNDPIPDASWKILDVGAGPITRLRKASPDGNSLDISAVDPLANVYAGIWRDAGISPPIVTRQGFAEDLSALFDPETFDMTYMQNALDHSFDPVRAIEEMLLVTKVGGIVVLIHATDEAEREAYIGLHQWNFNEEDGRYVIWNKSDKIVVDPMFSDFARFETIVTGSTIKTVIRKDRSLPIDVAARHKARLQSVLAASMRAMQDLHESTAARSTAPAAQQPRKSGLARLFART